jgi:serine/threonine protein kinase
MLIQQEVNPFSRVYTIQDAMQWSVAILEAIIHLHTQAVPIIHRDIKLENVLITNGREAKLADYGLCAVRDLHFPAVQLQRNRLKNSMRNNVTVLRLHAASTASISMLASALLVGLLTALIASL